MQNILEIRDLGRSYVNFRLEHISFSIPGGTIMGLVGENGVIHGLDHFGWSAPYKVLDEKFGYNGATVAAEVKKMLGK